MKKLYSILNNASLGGRLYENILDMESLYKQLDDTDCINALEQIFKIANDVIEEKKTKISNQCQQANPDRSGKAINYEAQDDSVVKKYFSLLQQLENAAKQVQLTNDWINPIIENPKEFMIGFTREINGGQELELLVPQGSNLLQYIIRCRSQFEKHYFFIAVTPLKSYKTGKEKWYSNYLEDKILNPGNHNFVLSYGKSNKSKMKNLLYDFKGFIKR